MSITAKFIEKVDYCPHCGSRYFSPIVGWKAKASSWAVKTAINSVCKKFTGGMLKASDFVEVANPEDFAKEYLCDNCRKIYTRADCLIISYEGDDYKPGDDIEYLVIDIFEHSTCVSVTDTSKRINSLTNYQGRRNFEANLASTLPTNELVIFEDIADFVGVDVEDLTICQIINYYRSHVNELDEYANLSFIDKVGLRETADKAKQIVSKVSSSNEIKETISAAKDIAKGMGIDNKEIKAMKNMFKGWF